MRFGLVKVMPSVNTIILVYFRTTLSGITMSFFSNIKTLFYPKQCMGCGNDTLPDEEELCSACFAHLPFTGFEAQPDNMVAKLFWGRVSLHHAYSVFYFNKGLVLQRLIHALKYKDKTEVGVYLGNLAALAVQKVDDTPDYLVPVPLHPHKLRKRGYNQCHFICKGISEITGIPLEETNVVKAIATETQTNKNRIHRWQNVEGSFSVADNGLLNNKHILLVDDVITTGATIEACVTELLKIPGIKITVASLAMAD